MKLCKSFNKVLCIIWFYGVNQKETRSNWKDGNLVIALKYYFSIECKVRSFKQPQRNYSCGVRNEDNIFLDFFSEWQYLESDQPEIENKFRSVALKRSIFHITARSR